MKNFMFKKKISSPLITQQKSFNLEKTHEKIWKERTNKLRTRRLVELLWPKHLIIPITLDIYAFKTQIKKSPKIFFLNIFLELN